MKAACRPSARAIESLAIDHDGIEWVIIRHSATEIDCREGTLVLHAAGIRHEVRAEEGKFAILVAIGDAERSRAELEANAKENPDRSEGRPSVLRPANRWSGVLCFSLVLLPVAAQAQRHAFGVDWFEAGKTHAGLIRQGEWWRIVTALTLHADGTYLLANIVIGGLVGLFVGQSFGSRVEWFLILVGGAFGNLLNALFRRIDHTSVGASTAVFAGLGPSAALAWRRRRRLPTSWMHLWAPLIGGVLLLSFLGTGGGRTDVAAHVLGFASGVLLGFVPARSGERAASSLRTQIGFGLASLAILTGAWALALARQAP